MLHNKANKERDNPTRANVSDDEVKLRMGVHVEVTVTVGPQ